MKRSIGGALLFSVLSTTVFTLAQAAITSLRGTVRDPTGALVPGARVVLRDTANGQILSTTANSGGQYSFPQISPARYTISVAAVGFGTQSKIAELLVDQPATVDFALTVQPLTVTVDVSAAVQTLNTTDASLGNSANAELIEALPSETRNVPDFLSLQPGVLYLPYSADSRNGAINGGRSDQGNITLDGVDDNDQVNGYAFHGVLRETQDSIQEFRITTSNANADSGRSSGAQISLVTKSGTNHFHGSAYEYYRPPFTAANNWFNKQAELHAHLPNVPTKVLRNIFGVALGGPVKQDKLFFFGNYEGSRQAEDAEQVQTVATAGYAAGNITYPDASNTLRTVTAAQVTALDSACQICNTSKYPFGPGPNQAALKYFNSMPLANGTLTGDGYNEGSYTFASPNPIHLNTTIGRIDFAPNDRHRIFARGNLQKDVVDAPEQFPGQGPSDVLEDNTKGMTFGDTWTIAANTINDIRYGYVRQGSGDIGLGKTDFVDFEFLSTATAETRSVITNVPLNNIVDHLSWIHGKHSIQVGANWRLIHQNASSDRITWQSASSNPLWLGGSPPAPTDSSGNSLIPSSFANSYQVAFANLVGTVPLLTNSYNYHVDNATSGSLLPDGAYVNRHFRANEYEWYAQDEWRIQPGVVLTFGIRHTILQTPWETHGQQVAPTVDTHAWYLQREAAAQSSRIDESNLQFSPAGKYYGKPAYWPKSKNNFAPRFAIAYSPDKRTSIRAGAGIYYDHYGEALVRTFDLEGSFGMSALVTNPFGVYAIEGDSNHPSSPRFLGRTILPAIKNAAAPAAQIWPFNASVNNFAITWGLDNRMKTPYSEAFDLSVQRQLPGGFTLETAYVGRLGRHLLQSLDLAEPVDYVDPMGAGDYYAGAGDLSRQVDRNGGRYGLMFDQNNQPIGSTAVVTPVQYFEDVFPFMANLDYSGESATQAIYNHEWAPYRAQYGATTSLSDLDFYGPLYGSYPAPSNWSPHFWQNQFSSLYVLSSIGSSYYNAGQLTLRHPSSHGLELDFSYTFSKSIDMGSDAERNTEFTSSQVFSSILNSWKPSLNRGASDFDTRHLITLNWVYAMPFGRGKIVMGGAGKALDGIVGNWQWSGICRWSSGLPYSLFEPGWTTDWQIRGYGVATGVVKTRRHFDAQGNPQFFADPMAINDGVSTGSPVRLPYPGEAGQRNTFRGDGYLSADSSLSKTWRTGESGGLKFAWEVYNLSNTARFDPASIGSSLTQGDLGVASSLLTQPRRMQFSLRYDF